MAPNRWSRSVPDRGTIEKPGRYLHGRSPAEAGRHRFPSLPVSSTCCTNSVSARFPSASAAIPENRNAGPSHSRRRPGHRSDAALKRGAVMGVRGPFGSAWPVDAAEGNDVVLVAGGIGLAPLRPAIYHLMANRTHTAGSSFSTGPGPIAHPVPGATGEMEQTSRHRSSMSPSTGRRVTGTAGWAL